MLSLPQHIPTLLRDLYYTIKSPVSYSSGEKLYKEAKKYNSQVTRKDVDNFLSSQFGHTLHHRVVRRFKRNPIVVSGPEELFQADLVDLQGLAKANDGIKFILTIVDVFSKMAYAFALKNKSGTEVRSALSSLFERGIIPETLQTDSGKEFLNSEVQSLLKNHHVMYKTATNEKIKCAVVERFQRTLQNKLFKYLTSTGGSRYVDVLQDAVAGYNNSVHSATGLRPLEVSFANKDIVFRNLYGVSSLRELLKTRTNVKTKLKVGETVRIARKHDSFRKGYVQTFSDQLYIITHISQPLGMNSSPMYRLKSIITNRELRRRFYSQELVKVSESVKSYHRPEEKQIRDDRRGVYGYA